MDASAKADRAGVLAIVVLGGLLWSSAAAAAGELGAGRDKAAACSACHGLDGLSLRPDVPHIAGQSEIYMRRQLEDYRSGERVHPEMSIVARDLSDADIEDLVAYYSAIRVSAEVPE